MKIIKKKVPNDDAFPKNRFKYIVGSWSFPTRKQAEEFIKRRKK